MGISKWEKEQQKRDDFFLDMAGLKTVKGGARESTLGGYLHWIYCVNPIIPCLKCSSETIPHPVGVETEFEDGVGG